MIYEPIRLRFANLLDRLFNKYPYISGSNGKYAARTSRRIRGK